MSDRTDDSTKAPLSDPDLDRLVRELNEARQGGGDATSAAPPAASFETAAAPVPETLESPRRVMVAEDAPLERLLARMVEREASDLLLVSGLQPMIRVHGELEPLAEEDPLEGSEIGGLFREHMDRRAGQDLAERGAADFTLRLRAGAGGWRFRVNLHRERGEPAAALRALPRTIPALGELNLPARLAELVKPSRGLVLLCGPTGAGKSSTLAALIHEVNRTRTRHVITIEDPLEYEHVSNRSVIEHVEVGRDSRSFAEALRAALRQDPDIILVGEMRDLETVATAVSAAETGHLVLATVHTNDAVQAIHRLVDVFPAQQQNQIRQQLALALSAVVVQQLVPRADGRGRVPAVELLHVTPPVRHHIRNEQTQKIYNEITLGKRSGMISMEESLADLVRAGAIDLDEARARASRLEELDSLLGV